LHHVLFYSDTYIVFAIDVINVEMKIKKNVKKRKKRDENKKKRF